jgi:hypothetical protein
MFDVPPPGYLFLRPSMLGVRCSKFDVPPPSLTVASLGKAAAALGRKVELRFVPA